MAGHMDPESEQEPFLLDQHSELHLTKPRDYEITRAGKLRAYWLGIVVCFGGFLCKSSAIGEMGSRLTPGIVGYDSGIIGKQTQYMHFPSLSGRLIDAKQVVS
jgi:hypothetical protein